MDPTFWHERWTLNRIGFHEGKPNAFLLDHLPRLALAPGARIFVPLCGKTRDIAFLLAQGLHVAGAELSQLAVSQLFAEMEVEPAVTPQGPLTRYAAPGLDIWCGDIFDLSRETLGPVDAVYDRAALVALPPDMRARYGAHLADLTARAPQLLLSFEYDQAAMDGPPFSVSEEEIRALYGADYDILTLERTPLAGGLRGGVAAMETAFLVEPA